ncbi:Uncharacterized protein OBRU01_10142 [Operophtera brumata]|uniref:Homeobox domain-containing protein n=1 Tax=Operophtera brumata TaxID=104452 RepID=A0A0L7LE21_OPEBR|nr:Uncharacterized protein OBRU01_10142 [Operophtera brumata]
METSIKEKRYENKVPPRSSLRISYVETVCGDQSALSKKQRKARTAFTDHQLQTLEKSFERQKYLSVQDRMELAAKLGLTDTQNHYFHLDIKK